MADKERRVIVVTHGTHVELSVGRMWYPTADLAPEARHEMDILKELLAKHSLHPARFYSSHFACAKQTRDGLIDRIFAGKRPTGLIWQDLGPRDIGMWEQQIGVWQKHLHAPFPASRIDTDHLLTYYKDLCRQGAQTICMAIEQIAGMIYDGDTAVAVSHHPLVDLAEMRFMGGKPLGHTTLKPCSAVVFRFSSKDFLDSTFLD